MYILLLNGNYLWSETCKCHNSFIHLGPITVAISQTNGTIFDNATNRSLATVALTL